MRKRTWKKHFTRLIGGALGALLLVGVLSFAGGEKGITVLATAPPKTEETAVPTNPVLLSKTDTSIRVRVEAGQEVRLGEGAWQTQENFTGLTPGTSYSITARFRETDTKLPSKPGPALVVSTKASGPEAPSAPVLARRWDTMIAIEAVEGQEYSINNGSSWQASRWFRELRPATAYSIVTRLRETDSRMAGKTSAPLQVTTKKPAPAAPSAPVLRRVTETSIEVETRSGTEYSINGGENWRRDGIFTGLTGNRYYDVLARLQETDDTMASLQSPALSVLTKSLTPAAPPPPRVLTVTTTSILVSTVSDMEYSIDGARTWQAEGLFENLEEDKEYTIVARYKETDTRSPSRPSEGVKVTTVSEVEEVPPEVVDPGALPPTLHNDSGQFTYSIETTGGTTLFRNPEEDAVRRSILTLEDRIRLRRGENIHVRFEVQILQPDMAAIFPEGIAPPSFFRLIEAYRLQAYKTLEGEEEVPLTLTEGLRLTNLIPEVHGGHGRYLLLALSQDALETYEDQDRVQASFSGDLTTENLYLFGYDSRSVRENFEVETPEPQTPIEEVESVDAIDWFSRNWWNTVFIYFGVAVLVVGGIFYKIRA